MPFALYALALAVFAQATSEFMLSGLLPGIAADLGVSVPAAGALTSAFAVGMVVGAPTVAALARRVPPRRALAGFLTAFVAAHVAGALTPGYAVLLVSRVVAALANAGFLAVALVVAGAIAGTGRTGRATSTLLAGTTLACVAGVPAGALLGELAGWRATFWAVAAIGLPALAAVLRSVPAGPAVRGGPRRRSGRGDAPRHPGDDGPTLRAELGVLRRGRLAIVLLLGALVNGATFCVLTYLAPVATGTAGLPAAAVPGLLALFGLGAFAGTTVAGRLADRHPVALPAGGGSALLAVWVAFALLAGSAVATVVLVGVAGAVSFAVGTALIARALALADGAPTLAGGYATAAFNVGAAIGPLAGGLATTGDLAGAGPRAPLVVAVVMVAAALGLGVASACPRRSGFRRV